jgi:NAD(P)H-hydrate epimerase
MPIGTERIIVDGLLGTGATGSPRGAIGDAVSDIVRMRNEGAVVVALDVPSGLDASSGESDQGVRADLTISFGTAKFGQLLRRSHCGTVVVVDIGLGDLSQKDDSLPLLVSGSWVREHIPSISAEAHKGERRRVAIVGGSAGMAGAVALAAQGSLRSGAGLISVVVHPDSIPALQASVPQAIAAAWPGSGSEAEGSLGKWAHCVVLGPGLGTDSTSRAVAAHVLGLRSTPLVIDADALNILASESNALANAGMGRAAVLTPHAGEMARLMNVTVEEVLAHRVELAAELARRTGAAVLLKGVPSVIASPSGRINVSAAGSPALATGGSGDVLSGLLGTLLAQTGDPFIAASCAAWLHGRAGEMAAATHGVRGATLSTVLDSLDGAFAGSEPWAPYPVLAELPAIS